MSINYVIPDHIRSERFSEVVAYVHYHLSDEIQRFGFVKIFQYGKSPLCKVCEYLAYYRGATLVIEYPFSGTVVPIECLFSEANQHMASVANGNS